MKRAPGHAVLAVTAGYFLVMFAVSPVSVVLPSLADSLGVKVDTASWVMTAYLLPLTACLLPAGRLGDIVGHRRIFVMGLVLTAVTAFGAGLATDLWQLLAARALQGVGAALVSAASLPIITATVEDSRRGRAIALTTMSSTLGAMAGTALAPAFVQYLNWRWAFFTGGAAGMVALILAARMGQGVQQPSRARLDWAGAVLLLLTLSVASLSLNHFHEGPETFADGWTWHLPMHLATALLLAMFVLVETRVRHPLIRFDQLRHGPFTTAVTANGVLHMTMMMATFAIPFLIQRGMGLSAVETGVLLVAMQACTVAVSLVAGAVYDRTRWAWLCPLAMTMVAGGLTVLGLAATSLQFEHSLVAMIWLGTGSGAFMTTNNTRIMGSLAAEYRGFASGMLETTRQYGHTLGVTIAAAGLATALGAGLPSGVQPEAVRAGFGHAAFLMGLIAWLGVALAAYPLYAHRIPWPSFAPAPRVSGPAGREVALAPAVAGEGD
ncbi:MAG TPA: MFS transporter [Chloroflexota bacterium]|jgi:MFS family permease|nr:MFS transporter [Chloroflexota bacterium]